MAAGTPYFAWIDASETVFGSEHMRWDENIFSFTCEQSEGDPASLTVVVKRPRNVTGDPIGLLGPGRKIWCWFALDCGPALFRFRGRLVGIPTSIFEELVTLEFVARPMDIVAQKNALAASLRVLPYYDEVVIDESRRADPEVVLEGYTKNWHYDRETHVLTVSDEIDGEDGLVEFDGASEGGKVLYDGLALELTSGPLSRVDVYAEYTWTQLAFGTVELTNAIEGGTGEGEGATRGVIQSFTMTASDWPKTGTQLGEGWFVESASARELYDLTVKNRTSSATTIVKWWDGDVTTVSYSDSEAYLRQEPPGSVEIGFVITDHNDSNTWDKRGHLVAHSDSTSAVRQLLPMHHVEVSIQGGYKAERPFTELITFSMIADVQHILTDPEDGEALTIDDIRSVDLSLPIGEPPAIPMVDTSRRSYISTARGNQSLEYLLAVARAHLMKRARVVEITVAPKLERMPEITLRKNCFVSEPRIGEALGKIIGYSIALDGADGRIACELTVGCTIGRGGTAVTTGGTPTYAEAAYTGADYQVFTGRHVAFDSSITYEPPVAAPNDDGLNFQYPLTPEDVLLGEIVIRNGAQPQRQHITPLLDFPNIPINTGMPQYGQDAQEYLAERALAVNNALREVETVVEFKLKNMNAEFTSDYQINVSELKIPTGYNLEVV